MSVTSKITLKTGLYVAQIWTRVLCMFLSYSVVARDRNCREYVGDILLLCTFLYIHCVSKKSSTPSSYQ